jgi:dolichyl-phosphate-mannose--protein O-mannosyl transferase
VTPRARWTSRDGVALLLITAAAAWLRADHLGRPAVVVFDEFFYARESCFLVYRSEQLCGVGELAVSPHPPLGKWLIALGIRTFGYEPLGWRIAALVAGIATIALVYLLARWTIGSTLGAALAAGLFAIDPLHFVHSRIAMLDVFVTAFVVAAFVCLALDHRHQHAEHGSRGWSAFADRRWLLAAGALGGAAAATKWVGFLAVAGVLGFALASAWSGATGERARDRALSALRREWAVVLVATVVLPLAVYTASFIGAVDGDVLAPPWQTGSWARNFLAAQKEMLAFHLHIRDVSPYTSPAWSWPLIRRPVVYYAHSSGTTYREILAIGNPIVWWASILALVALAIRASSRRGRNGAGLPIVAGFGLLYFPWLVVSTERSFTFLFYLLPAVPFMCLAIAAVADRWAGSSRGRAAITAFCLAAVASFVFFHPVLTAAAMSPAAAEARHWFDDCDVAAGTLAPEGWCWGSADAGARDP